MTSEPPGQPPALFYTSTWHPAQHRCSCDSCTHQELGKVPADVAPDPAALLRLQVSIQRRLLGSVHVHLGEEREGCLEALAREAGDLLLGAGLLRRKATARMPRAARRRIAK